MLDKLNEMLENALIDISSAENSDGLFSVRQKYIGKKGDLTQILKGLSSMAPDERRSTGSFANEIKQKILNAIEEKEEELIASSSKLDLPFDMTLPGIKPKTGGLHPIKRMSYDLNDAFLSLGFDIYQEDDITSVRTCICSTPAFAIVAARFWSMVWFIWQINSPVIGWNTS